ncbi:ribonuclease III [Vulgatibacter incomptus]|uniref:Ribonuclease 3 n=1 Tax=Vulgatibacter incomptus TaxID=1391653 RepID=A0A0K1PBP4_9BACT|nr:ribonuclease III [Vulgatibacter incomptus]AKU90958.1 Ribonuclease III [Vulgatibacter incomptus]
MDPVAQLEQRLQIPLPDRQTALAALTHKSYVNEHRGEGLLDNERLEFLGDAVIDLAIGQRLMERFPEASEGTLSKLRASIVDEEGLFEVATSIGLGELLFLGRGEELSGGRTKPSLLADALEAVIAVLYLDGGLPKVLAVVDRLFLPSLERAGTSLANRDFKTQMQELAQARLGAAPRYRLVEERGPDHAKVFSVELWVGETLFGRGEGRSKKDAEQLAAREAIGALGDR